MKSLREVLNKPLREPIPTDWLELLKTLRTERGENERRA